MQRNIFTLTLLLGLVGCVRTAPFPRTFIEDTDPGPEKVLGLIQNAEARNERPIVVGISQAPEHLFAWDFQKGLLWKKPIRALSSPRIAGSMVVIHQKNGIVGYDLKNGRELFSIDENATLVGTDGNDSFVAITLAMEDEEYFRGLLIGVSNDHIVWERELDLPGGVPTVVNDFIVLPWGTNRVSVVSIHDGMEYARWILKDSVAGHAFVDRGSVYVGQHGVFRIAKGFDKGTKADGIYYSPVARPIPGQPGLMRASYEPVPPPEHAEHRVNLNFRMAGKGDKIGFEDGILYLHFYRYLFALDGDSDAILWIYQSKVDIVGSSVQPGGIYLVDNKGQIKFLTAQGVVLWEKRMEVNPMVVHIRQSRSIPPQRENTPATTEQEAPSNTLPSLQEQLIAAAKLDDARLAGARTFALEHLARFDNSEVTKNLLGICDDSYAPEPVRLTACSKLAEQSRGKKCILEALQRQASFIDNIPPPPMEALANSVKNMKILEAIDLLMNHLQDPATPASALPAILEAIEIVGDKRVAEPVERFLFLHHAEPREQYLQKALVVSMNTLATLKGKQSKNILQKIASDPMSMPGLRKSALKVITRLESPPEQQEKKDENKEQLVPTTTTDKNIKPDIDKRPRYLSMGVVAQVLRPAEQMIRTCMLKAPEKPLSTRISMVVHGNGQIEGIFVAPQSMQSCIEPLIRKYHFPATQTGRQQIAHVVQRSKESKKTTKKGDQSKRIQSRKKPLTRKKS